MLGFAETNTGSMLSSANVDPGILGLMPNTLCTGEKPERWLNRLRAAVTSWAKSTNSW